LADSRDPGLDLAIEAELQEIIAEERAAHAPGGDPVAAP
jgi:hypothetical protein